MSPYLDYSAESPNRKAEKYAPIDFLPKTCRDSDARKREAAIEALKSRYVKNRQVSAGLSASLKRQCLRGGLTRIEAEILSIKVRMNLNAAARGERTYIPTRRALANEVGCSDRTVTRAIARLVGLGLITPVRYQRGGRWHGKGLSTEFRTAEFGEILSVLRELGYRLGAGIRDAVSSAISWAKSAMSGKPDDQPSPQKKTSQKLPGHGVQAFNVDIYKRALVRAVERRCALIWGIDAPPIPFDEIFYGRKS